jgi:hypothetical protein
MKSTNHCTEEFTFKAVLSLVSGFIVMLVIGSIYTYGTLSVYIASYLSLQGSPNITTVDIGILFPLSLLALNIGIIIGYKTSVY